jgi:twitching motility protein PilU
MIEKDGSDLFLTTGAPPSMKAHGRLVPMTDKPLPPGASKKVAYSIMNEE